jgi:hypothetical protein
LAACHSIAVATSGRHADFSGELNYATFKKAAAENVALRITYSPGGTGAAAIALGQVRSVVIDGQCNSACAWAFVRNTNACFTSRASFGFHAAHDPGTGRRMNAATQYWLSTVRPSLRGRLQPLLSSSSLIHVGSGEMRAVYADRVCGAAEPRTEVAALTERSAKRREQPTLTVAALLDTRAQNAPQPLLVSLLTPSLSKKMSRKSFGQAALVDFDTSGVRSTPDEFETILAANVSESEVALLEPATRVRVADDALAGVPYPSPAQLNGFVLEASNTTVASTDVDDALRSLASADLEDPWSWSQGVSVEVNAQATTAWAWTGNFAAQTTSLDQARASVAQSCVIDGACGAALFATDATSELGALEVLWGASEPTSASRLSFLANPTMAEPIEVATVPKQLVVSLDAPPDASQCPSRAEAQAL